jgi:plasmid replication initiation protein
MGTKNLEEKNGLVVKSNSLINAMCDLSLQGNRFLAFAISLLDRDLVISKRGEPIELEIPVVHFAETFNVTKKNAYREIEFLATKLQQKIIELPEDETLSGKRIKVGLITKQRYLDREGKIWIKFDEDLVPHLIGLKNKFTQYKIKDVYQFQKASTWRLYELLRQYKSIGKRSFDLDEFKWKLNIENKYSRFSNLKIRVLVPAIEEINKLSDIKVQYSQIKKGRKINGLTFFIKENKDTKTYRETVREKLEKDKSTRNKSPELARILREDYKVSPKQAQQLANLAHKEETKIKRLLPELKARWERLPDKNPKSGKPKTSLGGYVFKALRDELTQKNLPGL